MQAAPSQALRMVEIEINHHCNRACTYCPNSVAERKEQGEMEPELFEKIMRDLESMKYEGTVSYEFYNEPMLAKNLFWFVQTTRRYLPKSPIDFYTNGTLLSIEKFRQLVNDGVTRFIVTKHEGVRNYLFDETYPALTAKEKEIVLYQTHHDLKLTNRGGSVDAGPSEPAHLTPCYIPDFLIAITVLGNVLPCFEDFHEESIMGNVGVENLTAILTNQKFETFRKNLRLGQRHKQAPCNKCNRTQVCLK
jgi:radical SAM protein with 4Fe4S-binding SPASM domain